MKRIILYTSLLFLPSAIAAQTLNWANQYGGTQGSATVGKVALAPNGDIVSTGYFKWTLDFDPSEAVHELVQVSQVNDCFIMRNAPDGSFISVIRLAGTSEGMVPLAVDAENNSYTLSVFASSFDYDPSDNVVELAPSSVRNVALLKYDGNGNLAWAKQFGSSLSLTPHAVVTDESGNLYATMLIAGDLTYDSQTLYSGLSAISRSVILKIDPSGNVIWHSMFDENTWVNNMAISPSGKLFTVGMFFGNADFDLSDSEFSMLSDLSFDAFMSVYNTDGSFVEAFKIGRDAHDSAQSLAFYPNGDVVMVGQYKVHIDCTPNGNGAGLFTAGAKDGSFIAKYDANLNLLWQTQVGYSAHTYNSDVAIDSEGNVCTTGWFIGTANLDPSDGSLHQAKTSVLKDGFISKLNSDGEFVYGGVFSGPYNYDRAQSIVAGPNGALYIGGNFSGPFDVDPSDDELIFTASGADNGFLIKLDDFAVSASSLSKTNVLNAYPNPSQGVFTIETSGKLSDKNIFVYNQLGQKVSVISFQNGNQLTLQIDGAKGIYFLEILWEDGSRSTSKLVKE